MEDRRRKKLENLTEQLENAQLKIEGLMFEAFNQQDKQLAAIQDGMELLTEILAHMDAVSFEMENAVQETKALAQELDASRALDQTAWMNMLSEGELPLLQELSEVFEKLRQGQENSLSCVHNIEEEIANQRSYIEGICKTFTETDQK